MNDVALQARLDRLRATSAQRWLFAAVAIAAAVLAAAAAELAADGHSTRIILVVALGAAVTAAIPDSHAGLLVIAVVVLRWAFGVDDVATPWSFVAAIGLAVFHTVVALMAVTPPSAVVDRCLLRRWLRRTGALTVVTAAVWASTTALHHQQLAGSAPLTFAALAALTAAVAVALVRTRD